MNTARLKGHVLQPSEVVVARKCRAIELDFPPFPLKPTLFPPMTEIHGAFGAPAPARSGFVQPSRAGITMNRTATRLASEAASLNAPRPRLRVLLVEDDPADRERILRELRKSEFEISAEVAV